MSHPTYAYFHFHRDFDLNMLASPFLKTIEQSRKYICKILPHYLSPPTSNQPKIPQLSISHGSPTPHSPARNPRPDLRIPLLRRRALHLLQMPPAQPVPARQLRHPIRQQTTPPRSLLHPVPRRGATSTHTQYNKTSRPAVSSHDHDRASGMVLVYPRQVS